MARPIRAAFVGAGNRAYSAHYPTVAQLSEAVEVVAISELEPTRLARGGEFFGLPTERRYTDLPTMLQAVQPELVYAIMGPRVVTQVALACLAAGAHVVIEKPPGANLAETEQLVQAAKQAGRLGMVTFQRRFAAVTQATRRRILERGPLTMCLVEFHKHMLGLATPPWGVSTLWEDVVHVVDLARYLCGGTVVTVQAQRAAHGTSWPNTYNALVRFSSGATAIISGNRSSGGRLLRVEAHGLGLGAYLDDFPHRVRFVADNTGVAEELTGAELAGAVEERAYDGLLAMHQHFLECVRTGQPALTAIEDALETMRLIEAIERGEG